MHFFLARVYCLQYFSYVLVTTYQTLQNNIYQVAYWLKYKTFQNNIYKVELGDLNMLPVFFKENTK